MWGFFLLFYLRRRDAVDVAIRKAESDIESDRKRLEIDLAGHQRDIQQKELEIKELELKTRRHAGQELLATLRQYATEALAVHHEHRERDLEGARELALRLLDDETFEERGRARHRLARLDRKLAARRPTTDTLQFGA